MTTQSSRIASDPTSSSALDALDTLTPVEAQRRSDEEKFTRTLPAGQWLLIKLQRKNLSSIIVGDALVEQSQYGLILAVGPEVRGDFAPGDELAYVEHVGLPTGLTRAHEWARNYAYVHENKAMGRQPRSEDEKSMKKPAAAPPAVEGEYPADLQEAWRRWEDVCNKLGVNPRQNGLVLGPPPGLPPGAR